MKPTDMDDKVIDAGIKPVTFVERFGRLRRATKGPLTVLEAQNLHALCQGLDCRLDGESRWKMVKNVALLRQVAEMVVEVRNELVKERLQAGQTQLLEGSVARAEVVREMTGVMEQEAGIELLQIPREKWEASPNVPPQVLEAFEGRIIPV